MSRLRFRCCLGYGPHKLEVYGVCLDTTRTPSTLIRYLKEEGVANRPPITINRRSFLSHSVSPDLRQTPADCIFNFDFRAARLWRRKKLVRGVADIWQLERGSEQLGAGWSRALL